MTQAGYWGGVLFHMLNDEADGKAASGGDFLAALKVEDWKSLFRAMLAEKVYMHFPGLCRQLLLEFGLENCEALVPIYPQSELISMFNSITDVDARQRNPNEKWVRFFAARLRHGLVLLSAAEARTTAAHQRPSLHRT